MIKKIIPTLCFLYLLSVNAFADTVFIPIDFGGSMPDHYIDMFLTTASEISDVALLDQDASKALLEKHFIDIPRARADDFGMLDLISSGAVNYHKGRHDNADEMFAEAFRIALAHPEFLAVHEDVTEGLWIIGAYWLQLRFYIKNDMDAVKAAVDKMIRIFPLRKPIGADFPEEIAAIYRDRMPNQTRGHQIRSVAESGGGCSLHVNGDVLDKTATYYVYGGSYAISKVCNNGVVRVITMDIYELTQLSLDSGLFVDFTYPQNDMYVEHTDTTSEALSERFYQLAKILGVGYVVGVGYVPDGHPYLRPGLTALLTDSSRKGIVRVRTAAPNEVATYTDMKKFVSTVFKGGVTQTPTSKESVFGPVGWTGVGQMSAGAVSLIVGAVFGGMALKEKSGDEGKSASAPFSPETGTAESNDQISKRDQYKLVAYTTLGIGAGLAVVGLGLMLFDKFYLEPRSDNLYRADRIQFQFGADSDGFQAGLSWTF